MRRIAFLSQNYYLKVLIMAYGVIFSTKKLTDEMFCTIITGFANKTRGYTLRKDWSKEYSDGMKNPSYIIRYEQDNRAADFAITKIEEEYSLENIMPKEPGRIPYEIAEECAKIFVNDFRKFLRNNSLKNMSVSFARKRKLAIENIIPGKETRKFFMKYINGCPLTHHPADIQRLDIFICAASRYCRKPINLYLLHAYLKEVLQWSASEAKWCRDRIEAGMEILHLNRKF
jgi:hypothetical protein